MIWNWLTLTGIIFTASWLLSGIVMTFLKDHKKLLAFAQYLPLAGNITLLTFTILLWISLERPPMRTMAETRLWYSFFIAWTTWIIYIRTKELSMFWLGFVMASVFLLIDIIHPEYQSKSLMPSLQSPWFIPHVVIYMISYAVLGSAWISSIIGLFSKRSTEVIVFMSMKLVVIGFGLLTLGMMMGAMWAKIAWGNYWSWDPKETWALLTWLFYLAAIHIHHAFPARKKLLFYMLLFSFAILMITWFGIRFVAPGMQSVHLYAK